MATRTSEEFGALTEGELYVAKYLHAQGIRFVPQKRINLKRGSGKGYRIIDFFLPEFDVYLEYNGQWDVNEWHRNRYRKKRNELLSNGLTLVEIYPNQLGIIEYSFQVKMIQTLSEGNKANGLLRSFKWKLTKGHEQWPDTSDWIVLGLINSMLYFDPLLWIYTLPLTALILGIKAYRLVKFWKGLSEYESNSEEELGRMDAQGIVEECLEELKFHGLKSSDHQLMQFLKGQNTSYFTELLESRGFGYFQHLSNEEVFSIIHEVKADDAKPIGFKKDETRSSTDWLTPIRETVMNKPIVKYDVDDNVKEYRQQFRRSHEPWEEWEVQLLQEAYGKTQDIHLLADTFERSKGAIQSRLAQLN